jgi:Uncharacterised nucleotidyltransferase
VRLFVPLLPDRRTTALLQAMLLDGDAAREAWSRARYAKGEARPLVALLYDAVRRNDLLADDDTLTYLRSAYLTESLRSRTYREIVNELTIALRGLDFLLIKGAAVSELFYPEPALRHAHDIEIVVPGLAPLRAALSASRFRPAPDGFVHDSGLPLRVHTRLPITPRGFATLPNGARTLDATDTLALTLVHAARWISRQSAQWVCDAVMILRRAEIEWGRMPEDRRVRRMVGWLSAAFAPRT